MYICTVEVLYSCEVKTMWGFVRAKWRARVSETFLARWYAYGGYMDVSGVVLLLILVIYIHNE